jgi:hypothetical protein
MSKEEAKDALENTNANAGGSGSLSGLSPDSYAQ